MDASSKLAASAAAFAILSLASSASAEPFVAVEGHAEAFAFPRRGVAPAGPDVRAAPGFGGSLLGGWAFHVGSMSLAPELAFRATGRPSVYYDEYVARRTNEAMVDGALVVGLRLGFEGKVHPSFFAHAGIGALDIVTVSQPLQATFPVDIGMSLDVAVTRVMSLGLTAAYHGIYPLDSSVEDGVSAPRWMHGFALGPRLAFHFPFETARPKANEEVGRVP